MTFRTFVSKLVWWVIHFATFALFMNSLNFIVWINCILLLYNKRGFHLPNILSIWNRKIVNTSFINCDDQISFIEYNNWWLINGWYIYSNQRGDANVALFTLIWPKYRHHKILNTFSISNSPNAKTSRTNKFRLTFFVYLFCRIFLIFKVIFSWIVLWPNVV